MSAGEQTAEIVHVPEPMLPMAAEQAAQAMSAYQELTAKLLTADDWQGIPGRNQSFVKRRGWAKLATFYGVSTELRHVEIDRDDTGTLLRARCIARATHPNGRYAEGDGACSSGERRFQRSEGRQKIEHDLPATAATRAVNRAISNLIGFGEVSAEETEGESETVPSSEWGELASEQLKIEAALAVQQLHPSLDGYQFMTTLGRAFKAGVPKAAARALIGLAWFATQPGATGSEREHPPENAPPDPSRSTYHQPATPPPANDENGDEP